MSPATMRVGDRLIGAGAPVFVIAEAGVNHNGDAEVARDLILEAKACGADCVKFQTFKAERIVTPIRTWLRPARPSPMPRLRH